MSEAAPVLTVVSRADVSWVRLKGLVLNSVSSAHTRRAYEHALDNFHAWYRPEEHGPFSRAVVQQYRAELEKQARSPSTINVQLAALRKLASEAADNGLLAPELAAGISKVRGARQAGVRAGNWLTREQAEQLLRLPNLTTLKGLRDQALLALIYRLRTAPQRTCRPYARAHRAARRPLGDRRLGGQGPTGSLRSHACVGESRRRPLDRHGRHNRRVCTTPDQ